MALRFLAALVLVLALWDCGLRERVAPFPTATAVHPSPVPIASPSPAASRSTSTRDRTRPDPFTAFRPIPTGAKRAGARL